MNNFYLFSDLPIHAQAAKCYTCSSCPNPFLIPLVDIDGNVNQVSNCNFCVKTVKGSTTVRSCELLCVPVSVGNTIISCCTTDLCNSANGFLFFKWSLVGLTGIALLMNIVWKSILLLKLKTFFLKLADYNKSTIIVDSLFNMNGAAWIISQDKTIS